MAEESRWWVNSDGDVRESVDELRRSGYASLPDPALVARKYGEVSVSMCTMKDIGHGAKMSVFVPLRVERIAGKLLWRWVCEGEPETEEELLRRTKEMLDE